MSEQNMMCQFTGMCQYALECEYGRGHMRTIGCNVGQCEIFPTVYVAAKCEPSTIDATTSTKKTIRVTVRVEIVPGYSDATVLHDIMQAVIGAGYEVESVGMPGLRIAPIDEAAE